MFGLKTIKERWFELNGFSILLTPVPYANDIGKVKSGEYSGLVGHTKYPLERRNKKDKQEAYKIDWDMTSYELNQAIPPAYTEYIGKELLKYIDLSNTY